MQPQPPSPTQHNRAIADGWRKQTNRVIAHVDLDAFYTQVEVRNDRERLEGKPVVVVQYNPFGDLATHAPEANRIFNDSNGSLIAVSYEARKFGVKRNMRGDEARKLCPSIQLVQVPTAHGKADLTHYRAAGKQVTDILARLAICEKASIDECYLDISTEARKRLEDSRGRPALPVYAEQVHVCGEESALNWYSRPADSWGDGEKLLACGANAVADLRAAVKEELGFSCSAGIAHCKILAKLASGLHKPAQQTLVSKASVPGLLSDLPIEKLRQLGGKFGGDIMQQLNIQTVGELAATPKARLEALFGESHGQWLYELAHGIDADEVKQRTLPKSISCGKTFQGAHALRGLPEVLKWLKELGRELEERITQDRIENAREPKLLTVHAGNISRSGPLRRPTADAIAADGLALLKKWTGMTSNWTITGMSLGVSNFVAAPTGRSTLARFMKATRVEMRDDESPREPPQTSRSVDAVQDSATIRPQAVSSQRQTEGQASDTTAAQHIDADVWAALPADIQHELSLEVSRSRNTNSRADRRPDIYGKIRKRPKRTPGPSISRFFCKKPTE